jgi:hypothetical protein
MCSSLLVSVDVKVFHAMEAYWSLDITWKDCRWKGKSYGTNETQQLESLWKYIVHMMVKIKFSIKNNSQIFNNSICTIYTRSTKFIFKGIMFVFLVKEITLLLLTFIFMWFAVHHPCIEAMYIWSKEQSWGVLIAPTNVWR